jgi:hypothetical protein
MTPRNIMRLLTMSHWFHVAALRERRSHRNWRALAYGVIAGILAALRLLGAASILMALWVNAPWLGIILFVVMASRTLAPVLIRYFLVPGGNVKLAYYTTRLQKLGEPDEQSYALVVSAWAAMHCQGHALAKADGWIHAKCTQRKTAGDTEVATVALLTAARGPAQLDTAIALMRSVEWMVERHPAVRELAGEFLAVHDAQANRWQQLLDVDPNQWPASPLRYFLEGVAARRRDNSVTQRELWARWAMAPHRSKTWALLKPSAVAPPLTEITNDAAVPASVHTSPLAAALAHATACNIGAVATMSATELEQSALLWHAAIESPEMTQWLSVRFIEEHVRTSSPSHALDQMTTEIATLLATASRQSSIALPQLPAGRLQTALNAQLRHQTLDALEQQFASWAEHCEDQAKRGAKGSEPANADASLLSLLDQWRTFVALRQRYSQAIAIGGNDLRRLAFPRIFEAGNLVAVAWWNHHQQYVASHAISLWLLDEARAVGDSQAMELGAKNCRLAVKTRTGVVRSIL